MSDPRDENDTGAEVETEVEVDDHVPTVKDDGLGQDGTIPNNPAGIAAGHTGEASGFEPEEDEAAENG